MADGTRHGEDWSDEELDAIVADYFAMLRAELAGQSYVKSHHRAVLVARLGRSHGSVEFKHQNISAVLMELGLPWIWGYKPASHSQGAIAEAIDRYLSGHRDMLYEQGATRVLHVAEEQAVFTDAPPVEAVDKKRPEELDRLVRKFDPVERDFRNRQLGRAGEEFVVDLERNRLNGADRPDLANKVRWIAEEEGDGAGFDVLSFDPGGDERLIEVKTTNGAARTPFFLTRNEVRVAESRAEHWRLYRVHLFAQKPRVFTVKPPLDTVLHLSPESWRASFRAG